MCECTQFVIKLEYIGFGIVWLNPNNINPEDFIWDSSVRCEDQYRQYSESTVADKHHK